MSSMPPGPPPQGPPYMPPQGGGPPQYPPQYQQQYPQQYPPQYPQAQPPKKSNALMWILIAVGVIVCLGVGAISIGSYLVYRTVKNSGFDPDLMKKNPGLALTKMAALLPGMQVVSTDDSSGTVTVREKATGKMLTFRWDPDKKSLVIVGDDGKEVKFSGDDKNGGVSIESGDGSLKIGAAAGNNAPAWAPVYPGTTPQGGFSSQTADGSQNTYGFKTRDPAGKVLDYFKEQLTAAGFKVNVLSASDQGGMLQANDDNGKRSVMVTAGPSGEGTEGSVTTAEKK